MEAAEFVTALLRFGPTSETRPVAIESLSTLGRSLLRRIDLSLLMSPSVVLTTTDLSLPR